MRVAQTNWISRSEGLAVQSQVQHSIEVISTVPPGFHQSPAWRPGPNGITTPPGATLSAPLLGEERYRVVWDRDALDLPARRLSARRAAALADFAVEHGERGVRGLGGRRAAVKLLAEQDPALEVPALVAVLEAKVTA